MIPPGSLHISISTEPSIVNVRYGYALSTIRMTCQALVHASIMGAAITVPTEDSFSRLSQLMAWWWKQYCESDTPSDPGNLAAPF